MSKTFRMLLIDDDVAMVRLLETVVRRHFGDRVELSSSIDATEAKEMIEKESPDVIVTDLAMPGVDGLEVLRLAKGCNPWTQVLMLTGHSSTTALLAAVENGAADYLLKPVDQAELIELLEQAIDRVHRWRNALHGTVALAAKR